MINYIYHGTSIPAANSIKREGKMRLFNEPYISFTSKYSVAKYYSIMKGGNERKVVLRMIITDEFSLSNKYYKNDGFEWVTKREIPVDELEIETKYGWVPLRKWDFIEKKIIEKIKLFKEFSEKSIILKKIL